MVAHSSPLKRPWLILRGLLAASAFALLAGVPDPIPLGAGHTLEPRQTFTDPLGQTHTRLVHRYQGLRVWGEELVSHDRGPGTVPTLTAPPAMPMLNDSTPLAEPLNLDLAPSVSVAAAQLAILPDFGLAANSVTFSSPELVIYPRVLDLPSGAAARGGALDATQVHQVTAGYALAYLIRVGAATGKALADAWDYLVDAHAGQVLQRIPLNQGLLPARAAAGTAPARASLASAQAQPGAAASGLGNSQYSGLVDLNTSLGSAGYLLLDTTRGQGGELGGNAVTDMGHQSPPETTTGPVYANPTNVWGNGSQPAKLAPTSTPSGQTVAVDADFGLQSTWDYYAQVHGRNGIDNLGSATYVRVNYGGNQSDTDNAYWQTSTFSMTLLDGFQYWPFNTLTVMGHEFTHGVTAFSAGLLYEGESGGLNEATSDIFGVMVDTYARLGSGGTIPSAGTNWIIPRYTFTPPGRLLPIRYMYKPSKDQVSPDAWSADIGGIDVHWSSGPMNRAFYFLSQGASANPASDYCSTYLPGGMTGIGNQEAAQIWYRALTTYLTTSSNYKQARTAALRAALDLFPPDASGAASSETIAVRKAFGAINVGNPNATVDDLSTPTITASIAPSGTVTPSGGNFTLASTPASPYGISEVDYLVDQVLVAAAFAHPFTVPQLDAAHLLANGSHTLTAAAFSSGGNQGVSLGVPFTVNNPVQQILQDPGLEGGGQGWTGDVDLVVQTDFSGTIAHSGYRYGSFSRGAGGQSLTLSQQVSIPAGTSALFSLWTQVQGNPALPATDTLQILVQPQGQAPVLLDTLTNQQNRADWLKRSYDLSAYLGQTVTLSLVSNINPGTGTAFLVDDFCLACSAAPQVQVQVSLTPGVFSAAPVTVDAFAGVSVGPLYAQVTGTGNTAVNWSILEGAAGGTLTPGPTPTYQPTLAGGFFHVVATSVADPNVSAQVSVQRLAGVGLVPAAATLETGASLPFTVIVNPVLTATVSASGGTLASSGPGQYLYTAPAAAGTYTITALSSVGDTGTATVTVIAPVQVTIAPATLTMVSGSSYPLAATVTGSAITDVTWTLQEGAAGGSISSSQADGTQVYTAPAAAGTYHLVATSVADPTQSAVLTVTVQAGGISVNPANPVILSGGTVAFQAFAAGNPTVVWSVPAGPAAGSVDSLGNYTAPAAPGSYVVLAAAGGLSASATVVVMTTNFSRDGKPFMNSADLAILADAWGSSPGMANWNPLCDLNGDGVVNDGDVTLFFTQFGGLP